MKHTLKSMQNEIAGYVSEVRLMDTMKNTKVLITTGIKMKNNV